ncbi:MULTISPECIES: tetratricopeptide repeat protein [Rhizobium/Agrobacterium group]|uniref:tetratricopeptide repeat protein n=1 Tax=Pararhizobium antarcticum TaxID=1798805 RepID=UPI000AD20AD2|nr:tetratricopeptide repeat protein [Pararhizobium antarcticum]
MRNARSKRMPLINVSMINVALLAAISALSVAAIALPSASHASDLMPSDLCDREAGSEHDLQRNMGFKPVATDDIKIGIALSACREAYNQGAGPRQTFQLARVLHKAGQKLQAMTLLAEAAEAGHALAMVNYAVMLGEKGDTTKEFGLYQKAAATGNILAAYNLGVAYRDGVGTAVNGALAAQWFGRAAAARDAVASFNLAVLFDEGTLLPEDNDKAAWLYQIAAERGNIDAMINLGLMLETGEGVTRDLAAAQDLYAAAARRGDAFGRQKLQDLARTENDTTRAPPTEEALLILPKGGRVR